MFATEENCSDPSGSVNAMIDHMKNSPAKFLKIILNKMRKFITSVIPKQYDDSQSGPKPKQEVDGKRLHISYPIDSRYRQQFINS